MFPFGHIVLVRGLAGLDCFVFAVKNRPQVLEFALYVFDCKSERTKAEVIAGHSRQEELQQHFHKNTLLIKTLRPVRKLQEFTFCMAGASNVKTSTGNGNERQFIHWSQVQDQKAFDVLQTDTKAPNMSQE